MHRDFWAGDADISSDKSRNRKELPFKMDSDTALILALVLLLQRENADPILTLALLYILT